MEHDRVLTWRGLCGSRPGRSTRRTIVCRIGRLTGIKGRRSCHELARIGDACALRAGLVETTAGIASGVGRRARELGPWAGQARRHPRDRREHRGEADGGGARGRGAAGSAAGDLAGYDAFVIGSASYAFHWRKEASKCVRRNRDVLAGRCGCSAAGRWAPRPRTLPRAGTCARLQSPGRSQSSRRPSIRAAIMSSSERWTPRAYLGRAVGQETAGRRRGTPRRATSATGLRGQGLGGRHRPRPERSLTGPVPCLGSLRETPVAIARKALPIRPPAA